MSDSLTANLSRKYSPFSDSKYPFFKARGFPLINTHKAIHVAFIPSTKGTVDAFPSPSKVY